MPRQNTIHGEVVFYNPFKGFGFIKPADGTADVWFGASAAQNEQFERGDLVEFMPSNKKRMAGKPSAFRVYPKQRAVAEPGGASRPGDDREHITTLRGEFET